MGAAASTKTLEGVSPDTVEALKALPEDAQKELETFAATLASDAPAKSAAAEAAADAPPVVEKPKKDLAAEMDNLLSAAGSATTSVKANEEKTAALNTKVARQRRKSKDLEQEVFGMDVSDIASLEKTFKEIDTDSSGFIEKSELQVALTRASKAPTDAQLEYVLLKYGAFPATADAALVEAVNGWAFPSPGVVVDFPGFEAKCTKEQKAVIDLRYITFDAYRKMMAEWEEVVAGIDRPKPP